MRGCGCVPSAGPDQTDQFYADEFSFAVLQNSPRKGRVGFAHLCLIHIRLLTNASQDSRKVKRFLRHLHTGS